MKFEKTPGSGSGSSTACRRFSKVQKMATAGRQTAKKSRNRKGNSDDGYDDVAAAHVLEHDEDDDGPFATQSDAGDE